MLHAKHYKKKVLNWLLSSDPTLATLKVINHILKNARNKQEMGSRSVFIYDYLNGKTAYESLAILAEHNLPVI